MNKKLPVLYAMLLILVATLACNFVTGGIKELSIENLRMAFDQDGKTPTTVYEPFDVFYVVGDLNNAPAGTVVEAKWFAAQIEEYEPGELIYEQEISDFTDESFSGTIYFQLSNENGWPSGDYQVEVYLNGNYVQTVSFSVQ
ncbi:MAG: hypothetical protein PVJ21_21735 [Anaerolineales bacterium]|jgi:hypothetical protein